MTQSEGGVTCLADVEAILLTGGASRRMGTDKASLKIEGECLAERTARLLGEHCAKVTILGRTPVTGYSFQLDTESFRGPRRVLDVCQTSLPFVFVASCDMPRFSPSIVFALRKKIADYDASIPVVDGFDQPLCALYKSSVLGHPVEGEDSMRALIQKLRIVRMTSEDFSYLNVDIEALRSCNTMEEFVGLTSPASGGDCKFAAFSR